MQDILLKKIQEKISNIDSDKKNIFILRGIPLNLIEKNFVEDIEAAAKNPVQYFYSAVNDNRKFFTYEEFILLKTFISAQYDSVYILNNNLYANQFPVETNFSAETKNNLLEHFKEPDIDADAGEEIFLGKIGDIFTGLREHKNILVGVYNDEEILDEVKMLPLFETSTKNLEKITEDTAQKIFEIADETDFVCCVRNILLNSPQEIFIRLQNCVGDAEIFEDNLKILQENFSAQTKIYLIKPQKSDNNFEHRKEYADILKNYWGYDNFRNFTIYDKSKLDDGIIETLQISQEEIISNIVSEVEHCESEIGKDIFVTAPTGSGKSVIFQVPAIYLAEKYNLLTLVISPLIGLMNDQVQNLKIRNYDFSETINSDIAPPIKEQIINKVASGQCHILYISPETLLSRSDIEQLIGDRTVGMVVIDEAHIVTTWGKQFRPDYWYLGDHIRKLRKNQREKKGRSFVIATFTATAIYGGVEDMYKETVESLHMLDPISYLGYIKRDDIDIEIDTTPFEKGESADPGIAKYFDVVNAIKRAEVLNKKTLIYFPEVKLIEQMKEILERNGEANSVVTYHGQLNKEIKQENYLKFRDGKKLVMLATKAFGMGIDINDIEIVMHYAPTGNVCDYVQEIGRVARDKNLQGEALYHYDKKDFKYINRLHGLSAIKKYQLIAVVRKVYEIFNQNKKNNLLLDAENFTYIFDSYGDENSGVNKVKTALLMIQRDFESRYGFSPITVRPIPLFAEGFFEISVGVQKKLSANYGNCCEEVDGTKHICKINLKKIWRRDYQNNSFPQFKYFLYSGKEDFEFNQKYPMTPALCVNVQLNSNSKINFRNYWYAFKDIVKISISDRKYFSLEDITNQLRDKCKISTYKVQNLCEVLIASMIGYRKNFSKSTTPILTENSLRNKYIFNVSVNSYFQMVEKIFNQIVSETQSKGEQIYLTNITGDSTKKYSAVLGILEAMDVLTFKMSGGDSSQIYVHINQIKNLKYILNERNRYENRILKTVAERHKISVKMLTYIYEGNFNNTEIWNLLESYFLGKIPKEVLKAE